MNAARGQADAVRVEGVSPTHPSVEAWSTSRLPFEPGRVAARPWLPAFRSQLRDALASIVAPEGEMLVAEFATDEQHVFDVENVLLYNVGLDAFRSSGREGVRFERRAWELAPLVLPGAHCFHRYRTTAIGDEARRNSGAPLATWTGVECDALADEPTASVAWLAMRTAEAHVIGAASPGARFQIHLTLEVPRTATASAVHLLKPLLDGTISAFHDYVGPDLDQMSLRLAAALREEQPRIRSLLAGSGLAVLGPRRVIGGWGETTQWNPADDLCVSGSLLIHREDSQRWLLSGEIARVD